MMKMEPPIIYLPEEIVEFVDRMLKSWQRLDRGRMNCELIGVRPGDEFELSASTSLQPSIPSTRSPRAGTSSGNVAAS